MKTRPIGYAVEACEMMMDRFAPQDLPPKGHFHYHQGVFLSGMEKTYRLCNDERYMTYIRDWVESCLESDRMPADANPTELDDIQPAILLFRIMDWNGDRSYEKLLEYFSVILRNFPTTSEGGLWHKGRDPQQMWLDGMYMSGPFFAEYGKRYGRPDYLEAVAREAILMRKHCEDPETGLYYHAWDESKKAPWADPETGRSPEFWCRAIGWVPVALLDDLEFMDENAPYVPELRKMTTDLLDALLTFQTESGFWYQIVDKADDPENWPETSSTCLYAAAMSKAIRLGLAEGEREKAYRRSIRRAFDSVTGNLTYDADGHVQISGVCIGTGVMDYASYLKRPTSTNDLHGVGAYLLMCEEAEQIWDGMTE